MNAHVTHYRGSKGAIEIGSMPLPYAQNALAKLQRESRDGSRAAEIQALAAHVAKLQEEHVEAGVVDPAPPAPMAEEPNPRAVLGGNHPPEATDREAIAVRISDLLVEAHAWADGTTVETQAQADEASRLIEDLTKAAKSAEAQRVTEKTPHDTAIAEIQGFWNEWIADRKTKNPGRVWKAIDALKACVKPYLDRLEAERQEAARKAHEEAEAAARAAQEAARAAHAADLSAQEAAEDLVAAAQEAATLAKSLDNEKPQARGRARAMGLRRVFVAKMTDRKAALLHYVAREPDAFVDLLQRLADRDVREGKRQIPGFDIVTETRL